MWRIWSLRWKNEESHKRSKKKYRRIIKETILEKQIVKLDE